MAEEERWNFLSDLDEQLLKGGTILSEWCCFIVKEADIAFANGANLASILTALAAIETHLRAEAGAGPKETLSALIESAPISDDLRDDLHRLRKYRNRWVHVSDPWDDQKLQTNPEDYEGELQNMAVKAAVALRRTLYNNQWV